MTSRERRRLHGRAVSVLMGCKSCKLDHLGELDETGIALDHLLTGRCVLLCACFTVESQ